MKTPLVLLCAVSASTLLAAEALQRGASRGGRGAPPAPACAEALGTGVSTGRSFCDVIIATKSADSVEVKIPAHRGPAKLLFDLHNRVAVPPDGRSSPQTFARSTAVVAVVGPKGEIGRGAAVSEFRKVADLFDRIGGGPAGGPKTVAPGPPTPLEVTIPAGITTVGIVGVRLEVLTTLGKQAYDTPGRPIAIASNVRVEYTSLR